MICCDHCPRSFHIKSCLKAYCKKNNFPYHPVPAVFTNGGAGAEDVEWFCPRCRPVVEKRRTEKTEKQRRAHAKEQALMDKKQKVESELRERAAEHERKRLEKQQEKEK